MTIRTLITAALVTGGLLATADSADAQWRRGYRSTYNSYVAPASSYNYSTPYSYSYPYSYSSPGVVYQSSYSTPMYYTDGGVIQTGYSTPYYGSTSYYADPYYGTSTYGSTYYGGYSPYQNWQYNNYVGGYSNLYGSGGFGVGTNGAVLGGRRIRW
jgi:hypothetical protein